jgi:hypothetical protein
MYEELNEALRDAVVELRRLADAAFERNACELRKEQATNQALSFLNAVMPDIIEAVTGKAINQ